MTRPTRPCALLVLSAGCIGGDKSRPWAPGPGRCRRSSRRWSTLRSDGSDTPLLYDWSISYLGL